MGILKKKQPAALPGRRQNQGDVRPGADDRQYIFARNRTLTGTTSSHVSDSLKKGDMRSPRSHVHHLAIRRRKIGVVFLVVLTITTLLFILLMQFTAVVTVTVSDSIISKKIDSSIYVKAINDYFAINPISRLRFALNQTSLKNYLVATVPEVSDVSDISFAGIGKTNIGLTMRRPVAGWTINTKQYYVDANGVAFERNYYNNPSVEIVDDSGVALQQGAAVASNRFLGFVGRVVALSKQRGYDVIQAIIPVGTTRQLEIVIRNIKEHVKLSIDRPAGEQVEDMDRSIKYLTSHSEAPSYIDVRVSGEAFYK